MKVTKLQSSDNNMQRLIDRLNMNTNQFAIFVGIPRSAVAGYIGRAGKKGIVRPTVPMAKKIIKAVKKKGIELELEYFYPG